MVMENAAATWSMDFIRIVDDQGFGLGGDGVDVGLVIASLEYLYSS